jgi:hypothetical protein
VEPVLPKYFDGKTHNIICHPYVPDSERFYPSSIPAAHIGIFIDLLRLSHAYDRSAIAKL